MPERIIVISGPTASGKSALAFELAQKKDLAIINADSLQIYKGLPILSSQPTAIEKQAVSHFLYSYLNWDESCSVALWLQLVKKTIAEISPQKQIAVVGGSGMYISALIEGISNIPQISEENKNKARKLYEELGHEKFKQITKGLAIDKQRLIREYEVFLQTGCALSFWQNQREKILPKTKFLHINLNCDREKIYQNCNSRFNLMLKNGALEEVKSLLSQEINDNHSITKTIGFFEIRNFLAGEISHEKMCEIASQKTRNYAKRQLTWFRNQLAQKIVFNETKSALEFLKNEI